MFVCLDARISYGHKTFSENNFFIRRYYPNTKLSRKKLPKTQNPVFVRSLLFLNTIVCEKIKLQAVDFSDISSVSDRCFLVGPVLVVCWPARWTDKPLQNRELIRNTALLSRIFHKLGRHWSFKIRTEVYTTTAGKWAENSVWDEVFYCETQPNIKTVNYLFKLLAAGTNWNIIRNHSQYADMSEANLYPMVCLITRFHVYLDLRTQ